MAETLTPAQKLAVENRGGKLLVSAAAGSGKTKVLVDRLLSYITDPDAPCNIDDFLLITYTKAAASELRSKIARKLTEQVALAPENRHLQKQIQRLYMTKISTVHAFCSDLLRENAYRLDISADFRVADERECGQIQMQVMETLLNGAYDAIGEDEDFQTFVETQGFGRDDRKIPGILLQVYHASQCHLDPDAWLDDCVADTDASEITDAGQTVWGNYLIRQLHDYLDLQMAAIANCRDQAEVNGQMPKVVILLGATIEQLALLRSCNTWDEIVTHKEIDYGRLMFPKSCADDSLKESIKAVREACKKKLGQRLTYFASSSEQVLADLASAGSAARGLVKLVRQFRQAYNKAKQLRRVLDFGDLEHKTLDLLLGKRRSGPTAIAYEIGQRFREIMVDEYQDSNAVQDAIFSALTVKKQNCFMVGDVKQSIYQFRLADPTIFLQKYNSFAPAETAEAGQGRKVLLSSNFRSAGPVIQAVNDVFSCCMSQSVGGLNYGEAEMLYEGIPHIDNTEPEVELIAVEVDHDTYAEEADVTAERIVQLLDGSHMVRQGDQLRPIVADDIVILLRSPGSVGADFQYALERRGIRCSTGAGADLLQTEEIGVLRSILQIISNPLQDIPLLSVLTSRVFQFSANDLAAFRGKRRWGTIYDALRFEPSEKVKAFLDVLAHLRREARLRTLSELLEEVFLLTKIDSIFSAAEYGEECLANLQAFCQLAAECEANGQKELDAFLDYLDALAEKGIAIASDQKAAGAVTIMSIHKSKGLEFPVVFLCGLSKGFNMESTRAQVLCDKDLGLGLSCVDLKNRVRYPTIAKRAIARKMICDSISEEMRVLYVAMTRAKDRLIMTYADKDLQTHLAELVGRMDLSPKELLTSDVSCAGTWVLLTALRRTEAGELFALGGKPADAGFREPAWRIDVKQAVETCAGGQEQTAEQQSVLDMRTFEEIKRSLGFEYPYIGAARFPSKQTATQLKGRQKDQEAAENADPAKRVFRQWRQPSFITEAKAPTQFGNAMHALMQYIRYDACGSLDGVKREISRLLAEGLLSEQEANAVDAQQIVNFFLTDIGRKIRNAASVLREFKFTILDNAEKYGCSTNGELVLLQGVVDCALIEEDGITVVDFKTDSVTEKTIESVANGYRLQVQLYADALSRIYETPVKSVQLYFFKLNCFVAVK